MSAALPFTTSLEEVARPLWEAQLAHPFVRGIADGTLDEEAFRRWLRQDWLYLKEYARLLAWAVAKADTLQAMRWYAGVLHLTLETEMGMHRRFAQRFGLDGATLDTSELWPTTRAYSDFLIRTAADGELADLPSGSPSTPPTPSPTRAAGCAASWSGWPPGRRRPSGSGCASSSSLRAATNGCSGRCAGRASAGRLEGM